ncbi:MAG: N-acetyltransferase [Collimonas sp.]|uniref:GNAT family N-acetyltransferase n=1 Tax=Collimonas sp. TaxID=1963772 RepID=UPI0032672CE5
MSITVRRAEAQDLAALQNLFLAARRQTYTWMDTGAFYLTDLEQQTRGETILVAEDDNESRTIAGFISMWEPEYFIHHLYVGPGRQRKGVGRALLAALPGWLDQKYSLKCLLLNHAAAAFYRATGFVEAGRGVGDDGEYAVFESSNGVAIGT